MHDITNKNNSAHLLPMGYQCTPIGYVSYIVIEISRQQARRNTHIHTHTHTNLFLLPTEDRIVLPFVLNLTLILTITSPIVVYRGPYQSLEMLTEDRFFLCSSPLHRIGS